MSSPPRSRSTCPPPGPAGGTDPLVRSYPAGARLYRGHSVHRNGSQFNDFAAGPGGAPARFSPFFPGGGTALVPVLYAGESTESALWETVFHDVAVRGSRKRVARSTLGDRIMSTVETTRELRLANLTTTGLSRLGVARTELIESGRRAYEHTVRWAQALHDCPTAPDGLYWISRAQDTSVSVVLFGDRVRAEDVRLAPGSSSVPLYDGEGYERVAQIADSAGITVTDH